MVEATYRLHAAGGTLMGCARYFREWHRGVQFIAVDSDGSVAFGGPGSTDGARGVTGVALAPDLGERYLDTIYQSNWVEDLYGPGHARLR